MTQPTIIRFPKEPTEYDENYIASLASAIWAEVASRKRDNAASEADSAPHLDYGYIRALARQAHDEISARPCEVIAFPSAELSKPK
ncbi:MAG: hypothetical protein KDA48_16840 [Amphiplicatus sp.]|nr:hypothetical protein [Amphiplicatus sp.]